MTGKRSREPAVSKRKRRPTASVDTCREAISLIYVNHDGNEEARRVLDYQLRYGKRTREGTSGYIIGYSRCGKTETIARFVEKTTGKPFKRQRQEDGEPNLDFETQIRLLQEERPERYPPLFMQMIEGGGKRILYADMTHGITPLIASQMILNGIFQYKMAHRVKEAEAGNILAWFMWKCHIDLFVIDEAQQMFRNMGSHALKKFASWLLALENSGSFGIVVAGALDLEVLFPQSDATEERVGLDARLMPFPYETKDDRQRFAAVVREFGTLMPFKSTPLADPAMTTAFFYATRGRIGTLAKLADTATVLAFENPKTKGSPQILTVADFAEAFDRSRRHDWRMKGINPFRDSKLPTIPLCIEKEEEERQKLVKALKPQRRDDGVRRPGSKLH